MVESLSGQGFHSHYLLSLTPYQPNRVIRMYTSHLYETDFYAWTQEQVTQLKAQQWDRLDTVNLIASDEL